MQDLDAYCDEDNAAKALREVAFLNSFPRCRLQIVSMVATPPMIRAGCKGNGKSINDQGQGNYQYRQNTHFFKVVLAMVRFGD